MTDPYTVLGLEQNTPIDVVKKSYRTLAKQYHPDYNKNDPKASEKFQRITEAYDIIVSGKYNPTNYQSKTKSTSTSSHPSFYLFRFKTTMSASFTGVTIPNLPGGPLFLKPGFIADERWTITRANFPPIYIDISYHDNDGFSHRGHDLYSSLNVTKKQLRENTQFTLTNHPNPHAKEFTLPPGVTSGKQVIVRGEGLRRPDNKPAGDLYLIVNILQEYVPIPVRLLKVSILIFLVMLIYVLGHRG